MQDSELKISQFSFDPSPIFEGCMPAIREGMALAKALYTGDEESYSSQPSETTDFVPHRIDMGVASQMRRMSPHHAACLDQIRDAAIGVGYYEDIKRKKEQEQEGEWDGQTPHQDKIADLLDPLCGSSSWESVLMQAVDDMLATGMGYLEVARDVKGAVRGIYWVPAATIHKAREHNRFTWWRQTKSGTYSNGDLLETDHVPFARFGTADVAPKKSATLADWVKSGRQGKPNRRLNEIIAFELPTNLWEDYGAPRYLPAVPYLHLVQQMIQQQSDFFHNRGVPDFLLFLMGVSLADKEWTQLTNVIKARAGSSNVGKGAAFQVPETSDKATVELVKLASDAASAEVISKLHDAMALSICSAHRVPPLLASITLAGKQGAANETVQALILFERQVVRGIRRIISRTLRCSLGDVDNGVEGLADETFHFASMLDSLDMFSVDTMARAKQESVAQQGRDFSQGTLKRGRSS